MTTDEFLSRVSGTTKNTVKNLIYPEGHPLARTFIPPEEWDDPQWTAWNAYKSSKGTGLVNDPDGSAEAAYRDGVTDVEDTIGKK